MSYKNVRLQVQSLTPLPKANKSGTFSYRVKGSAKAMEIFKEIQGEYLVEDEDTGEILWFTGTWLPFANIKLKDSFDDLEEGTNPWEFDMETITPAAFAMGVQAQAALSAMGGSRPKSVATDEDEEDSADEAELEETKPAAKPAAKPKRRIS